MNTIITILSFLLALSIGLNFYLVYLYTGKVRDADRDMIADAIEEGIIEIKGKAKRVKEELQDVGSAVKEVGNQIGDLPSAVSGKTRPGRKKK